MQTEEGASAAQTPEQRQRRNMDRYLDRPSLIGMLFILAVCCCILALLVDKVATSRASAGSAWGVGLAIGAGLAAADGCAIGMWWRASATRRRRRSMQARLGLPGLPRAKEPAWRFMVPFFALLVGPATAAFGAASYLLGHGSFPGVRHPRTLFADQLADLRRCGFRLLRGIDCLVHCMALLRPGPARLVASPARKRRRWLVVHRLLMADPGHCHLLALRPVVASRPCACARPGIGEPGSRASMEALRLALPADRAPVLEVGHSCPASALAPRVQDDALVPAELGRLHIVIPSMRPGRDSSRPGRSPLHCSAYSKQLAQLLCLWPATGSDRLASSDDARQSAEAS